MTEHSDMMMDKGVKISERGIGMKRAGWKQA